jgi:hypothetical protein
MVELLGKPKRSQKDIEQIKYLDAQVNAMETKLGNLEKALSTGVPLTESEESMQKLDELYTEIRKYKTERVLMVNSLLKLEALFDKMEKSLENKPSVKQLDLVSKRLKAIEESAGSWATSEKYKSYSQIATTLQDVEQRLTNLENVMTGILYVNEKLKPVVQRKKEKPIASEPETEEEYDEGYEEYEEEEGFVDRIRGIFQR